MISTAFSKLRTRLSLSGAAISSVVLIYFAFPLLVYSEVPAASILRTASELRSQGRPEAAISVLKQYLDDQPTKADKIMAGEAWNIIGAAYQDEGQFEQAMKCHELAIRLLDNQPTGRTYLASSLDNLAAVDHMAGRPDEALALRKKAAALYAQMGDHAGLARAFNNSALIKIETGDIRAAKHFVQLADAASTFAVSDDDDTALSSSVKGALALHDRDYTTARNEFENAIQRWNRRHGTSYYLIATALVLRAQAFEKDGKISEAVPDAARALEVARASWGPTSSYYWNAQLFYAQLIRKAGRFSEGKAMEKEANARLTEIHHESCLGCLISVESLRAR